MKFQIKQLLFTAALLLFGLQLSAQGSDRSNLRTANSEANITNVSAGSVTVNLTGESTIKVGDKVGLNRELSGGGMVTVGTYQVESINGSSAVLREVESKSLTMVSGEKVNHMTSGMKAMLNLLSDED